MIRTLIFAFGAVAIVAAAAGALRAEEPAPADAAMSAAANQQAIDSSASEMPAQGAETAAANQPGTDSPAVEPDQPGPAAEPAPARLEPAKVEKPSPAEQPAAERGALPAEAPIASAPKNEPAAANPGATPAEAQQARKDEPAVAATVSQEGTPPPAASKPSAEQTPAKAATPAPMSAEAEALRKALSTLRAEDSDEARNERDALLALYESRAYAPLWLTPSAGISAKGSQIIAEIKRAGDWGLDARDFALPAGLTSAAGPEAIAAAEIKISLAVLKYGRYARGGRIIDPSDELSSYLDRRPQLLKPRSILDGISEAAEPDAYLRSLHPQHPQFEKLRQKYLALAARNRKSAEARKLLANMEEWRWMPADMGDLYVWNNVPEFTQRVVKNGQVVRKENIVTGQLDKQTPIFSRQLRKITFRPTWIVPDSIKVRELWPNLLRGGSLMNKWGLEVLKDGEPVNWRKINWSTADIRNYEVIQPNGPKSVMGKVKFSFPSQHTVFMHDAAEREKWMFRAPRRTYSHGCMRVANPVELAEILLREDKGWDAARVREALNKGGNNNEIPIERKIMVHMTYFTALVDDDGKLHTFPDVYGHERRITLALDGKWDQIEKGRDHLAPVELDSASVRGGRYAEDDDYDPRLWGRANPSYSYRGGFLDSLFGGGYEPYPAGSRQYRR